MATVAFGIGLGLPKRDKKNTLGASDDVNCTCRKLDKLAAELVSLHRQYCTIVQIFQTLGQCDDRLLYIRGKKNMDKDLTTFTSNFGTLLWQWAWWCVKTLEVANCFSNFCISGVQIGGDILVLIKPLQNC